jgi:hypothetical protein
MNPLIIVLVTNCLSNNALTNSFKEISIISDEKYLTEYELLTKFLTKINEASRVVYDTCDLIDDTTSYITSNKPKCNYNVSYINVDVISVYDIRPEMREFFIKEKKHFCKEERIECGTLTIVVKIVDLVNSALFITTDLNNTQNLWTNLEIIDFYALADLYISSINNYDILSNITLSKHKANIILLKEKNRLNKEFSNEKAWFYDSINNYIGLPFKNTFVYIGDTLGSTIGTTVRQTFNELTPDISLEVKLITIGLVLLTVLRR